jgi:hypothetical protein
VISNASNDVGVEEFLPWLEPKVSLDTSRPLMEHALREAIHRFLKLTRAARDTFIVNQDCDEELYLDIAPCQRLVETHGIYKVPKQCGTNAKLWSPSWELLTDQDCCGHHIWQHDLADGDGLTIMLPPEMRRQTLAVRYSWTTSRSGGCTAPRWVFEDYADAIADGALAYLHDNPVDERAAERFSMRSRALFNAAVSEVLSRNATHRGKVSAVPTHKAHFYGG